MSVYEFTEDDYSFLRELEGVDLHAELLRKNRNAHQKQLISQLIIRKQFEKKLPTICKTEGIHLPPSIHLEQSSSEKTARFKASLVSGKRGVDLSAGFGVDSYFLAPRFNEFLLVEPNVALADLVEYNYKSIFKITNTKHYKGIDATAALHSMDNHSLDVAYIDPSRRDYSGKKVFKLQDCEPNLFLLESLLIQKAKKVLVKLSPMLDLKDAEQQLRFITHTYAVCAGGECKELLLLLEDTSYPVAVTHHAVDLDRNYTLSQTPGAIQQMAIQYSSPRSYLYEPNPCIHKLSMYQPLCETYGLKKLHPNTHLFTSDTLLKDFPGRVFVIDAIEAVNEKALSKILSPYQAHLTVRNFPDSSDLLRKKLKLADGGDYYLFATTLIDASKCILVCRKV